MKRRKDCNNKENYTAFALRVSCVSVWFKKVKFINRSFKKQHMNMNQNKIKQNKNKTKQNKTRRSQSTHQPTKQTATNQPTKQKQTFELNQMKPIQTKHKPNKGTNQQTNQPTHPNTWARKSEEVTVIQPSRWFFFWKESPSYDFVIPLVFLQVRHTKKNERGLCCWRGPLEGPSLSFSKKKWGEGPDATCMAPPWPCIRSVSVLIPLARCSLMHVPCSPSQMTHFPAKRKKKKQRMRMLKRAANEEPERLHLQCLGYVVVAMYALALRRWISGLFVLLPLDFVPSALTLGLIFPLWLHHEVLLLLHLRG